MAKLSTDSIRASELLLASQPDAVDLDRTQQSAADLAVAYLANPAAPMLRQATALRKELRRRLTSGAVRPHELHDLCVTLARVTGVLAYAAVDLGHPECGGHTCACNV